MDDYLTIQKHMQYYCMHDLKNTEREYDLWKRLLVNWLGFVHIYNFLSTSSIASKIKLLHSYVSVFQDWCYVRNRISNPERSVFHRTIPWQ